MNEIERAIDTCKQVAMSVPEYCADDLSITAVQALEKQIPKKTIKKFLDKKCSLGYCECKKSVTNKMNYCPKCGQKLDWGE